MKEQDLSARITTLESEIVSLKKAYKSEYNTSVVYNTKNTYGYSQAVESRGGTTLYLSGMTPWDKDLTLQSDTLTGQLDHALSNLHSLLEFKRLTFAHLVSLRAYIAKQNYYNELEEAITVLHRHFKGSIPCAFTAIGVTGLAQPEQLIELEAVAVY